MKGFKPLLAANADLSKIQYPVFVSPKLDGIRAITKGNKVLSRSLKPIPNKYVQGRLLGWNDFDGELIVGDPTAKDVFRRTESAVMSQDGEPSFTYYVFDIIDRPQVPYHERLTFLKALKPLWDIKILPQRLVRTEQDLLIQEEIFLGHGFEGIMIRSPDGLYKFGRSTVKEGILLKLKRFEDSEAKIIGFEEKMHNGNKLEKDELGYAKRSSHKANKKGLDTLGALIVRSKKWKDTFNIGTGFDDRTRDEIWRHKDEYHGRIVKFKYQKHGTKDVPRCPVFLGFRHEDDL